MKTVIDCVTLSGTLEYVTGDPDWLIATASNRLRALFADSSA